MLKLGKDAKVEKMVATVAEDENQTGTEKRGLKHKPNIPTSLDQVMTTAFTFDWTKPRPKASGGYDLTT